jgi:hypothetical protein
MRSRIIKIKLNPKLGKGLIRVIGLTKKSTKKEKHDYLMRKIIREMQQNFLPLLGYEIKNTK